MTATFQKPASRSSASRAATLRRLRRTVFVLAATLAVPAFAADDPLEQFRPTGSATFNHSAFDAILEAHVKPDGEGYNQVDYKSLAADHGKLDAYLDALAAFDPTTLSEDEAHAYWINTYNAKTLDVILDHYPTKSIKRINLGGALFRGGPWSKEILEVNGTPLTLDDVEHRIVRAIFLDPMSHYGLNCASYSCPNLMTDAYTGETLDALLAESGRQYVEHDRGVKIEDGAITASKIFDWYADDFGGEGKLKEHWASLATPEKAAAIEAAEIARYRYDWSLNDIGNAGS